MFYPKKEFSPTSDNNINKLWGTRHWLFNELKPELLSQIHLAVALDVMDGVLIVTKDKMVHFIKFYYNEDSDTSYDIRKFDFLCEKGVKSFVYGSSSYILILTETGEVYACGENRLFHTYCYFKMEHYCYYENNPDELEKLKKIYNEKLNEKLPTLQKVDLTEKQIVDVACGKYDSLALTVDGKVYTWAHCKCGLVEGCESKKKNQEVEYTLANKKIVSISCSTYLCMVVTSTGELYGWGRKKWKEEGRGFHYQPYRRPTRMTALAHFRIVKVACGEDYTLALTDEGDVYAFGYNDYGQLGIGRSKRRSKDDRIDKPVQVKASMMGRVTDIAAVTCGHTSVAINKSGRVFIWGLCNNNMMFTTPTHCPVMNLQEALTFYSCTYVVHIPVNPREKADKRMVDCLRKAFDDPSTSDFRVDIQGRSIYLHKNILRIRSKYFRTVLQQYERDEKCIVRCDREFCHDMYKAFFMFLYTGEIFDLFSKDISDLLELAELANIHDEKLLLRNCVATIKRKITVSNVVNVYVAIKCQTQALPELADFCLQFAASNLSAVKETDDFVKLDWQLSKAFISLDNARE